ncbi:cupin domain-containing protein [Saccharicrinis aurantiacus]|uniref:cupin domain-containing protein n=1 Tax=Saccharicrinis aurantiacus TaxID=1849719 RepID=UPI002490B958|nr:cupin domain-containing protein [Saccharicrinis aurantiacus]
MLNILIVYAVKEERVSVNMPNCSFNYCITGVGKVSAAIAVEKAIACYKPDLVINIGTSGTLHYKIGSVHLCKTFVDRDMEKLQAFGVPCKEDFSAELDTIGLFDNWKFDSTCNTGDAFLTEADGTGDVFDMESFAVARVCKSHKLPFIGIKCVTDIIGENSIKHWEEKLAEAQAILQKYIDDNPIDVSSTYIGYRTEQIINNLNLKAHPEGGWFSETYRSDMLLKQEGLPTAFNGARNALTSIYYLLEGNQFSGFHKIKSPEVWYFHQGQPIIIHTINSKGDYTAVEVSDTENGVLQFTVEPNLWFAATIKGSFGYSLVSCAVAPGFDFSDFEMASEDALIKIAPQHTSIIKQLCK